MKLLFLLLRGAKLGGSLIKFIKQKEAVRLIISPVSGLTQAYSKSFEDDLSSED